MEREKMRWLFLGLSIALVILLATHAALESAELRSSFHVPPPPPRHGVVGTIVNVTPPTIELQDRSGNKETVLIGTSTPVLRGPQTLSTTSLSVGQKVIIIGEPGEAHFIRILPQ